MNADMPPIESAPQSIPFALSSPGARKVYVAFFFNEWSAFLRPAEEEVPSQTIRPMVRTWVSLQKTKPGLWTGRVSLPAGRHEYLFLVDGAWVMDPEATDVCPDGDGGFNAVLSVPVAHSSSQPRRLAVARAI